MENAVQPKLGVDKKSLEDLEQGLRSLVQQRAQLEEQIHAQRGAVVLMRNLLEAQGETEPEVVEE